jgi:endonuclease/exonuclease/phosphatase (EEP) superfamily protein YafD
MYYVLTRVSHSIFRILIKGNDQWEVAKNSAESVKRSNLRVLTWNVYKKSETSTSRLEKLIPLIQNEDPDIVCIQEVIQDHILIRITKINHLNSNHILVESNRNYCV